MKKERAARFLFLLSVLVANGRVFAGDLLADVANADNAFGFKLLAETRKALPDANVFLSPPGLAVALSLVASGAEGKTRKEMEQVLEFKEGPKLNGANAALLGHLSNLDPKIKLEIANGLWTKTGAPIKPGFIADSQKNYRAEVASVDFGNPATVKNINHWASSHTAGKIPEIVSAPLDPMLRLIVLDALYFKGDWQTPFDKKQTHELPFHLPDGKTVQRPMMSRAAHINYYENDLFQAASLPYAGGSVSLYVFLPRTNMNDFLASLTLKNWNRWTTGFLSREGRLELPRFKMENKYELNNILKTMGMRAAFGDGANFSGISSEPLKISWVRQNTFVEVNEQGTEAAAVTGIGMQALAIRREAPPFEMIVDRPFFVAIRDQISGTLLFLGVITDPK